MLEFVQLFCGLSGSGFLFKLMPIHGHGELYQGTPVELEKFIVFFQLFLQR